MNGKKLIVMLSVLFTLFMAVPSFSAHNESEVRVVNLDVVGSETLNNHILVALATMKATGNTALFPEISMFKVSKDVCLIDYEDAAYSTTDETDEHHLSIDGKIHLRDRFSFTSFDDPSNPETAVTVAIVKPDGTVINLSDEAVSIDGTKKNLNSEICIPMEPLDVVLVFVSPVEIDGFTSGSSEKTSRTLNSTSFSVTAENSSSNNSTSDDPSSSNPANGPKDNDRSNNRNSKDNRGHGNNEDGIDGDNPGKGSGGPNADKDGNSGNDESNGGGSSVGNNSQSENDNNNDSKDNKGHGNNEDGIDGDNPGNGSGGPNADKDGNSGNDESNGGGSSVGNNNKSESGSSTGNGSGGNSGNNGSSGNGGNRVR